MLQLRELVRHLPAAFPTQSLTFDPPQGSAPPRGNDRNQARSGGRKNSRCPPEAGQELQIPGAHSLCDACARHHPFPRLHGSAIIYTLVLSFQKKKVSGLGLGKGSQSTAFAGLDNYVSALTDPEFLGSVLRVLTYGLILIPLMLGFALLFALLLDSRRTRPVLSPALPSSCRTRCRQ